MGVQDMNEGRAIMNEVFEKIKNELHKEDLEFMQQSDLMVCIDSIIDKVAVDYNNGWIPVSERLPEESLNSVIGWDTYRERCCFVQYLGGRFVLGDDTESVNITAWMPLPKQYKPKFVQKCVNPSRKEEIEVLNKKIRSIPVCTYPTNADRIRSMSDEELAKFLIHVETLGYNDSSVSGKLEMIEWLQSEVEVIG